MEHGFIGWLFIIVALIFIFGGRKRLEDMGAGFGGFMREFNKARREAEEGSEPKKKASARKPAKKKATPRKKG
jgi:Sec-independent protein translocase protein TatA